jgi:hypothetical protein
LPETLGASIVQRKHQEVGAQFLRKRDSLSG